MKYEQVRFQPEGILHKTYKTMDKNLRLAMLPEYDIFCVDLKEGNVTQSVIICSNEIYAKSNHDTQIN